MAERAFVPQFFEQVFGLIEVLNREILGRKEFVKATLHFGFGKQGILPNERFIQAQGVMSNKPLRSISQFFHFRTAPLNCKSEISNDLLLIITQIRGDGGNQFQKWFHGQNGLIWRIL